MNKEKLFKIGYYGDFRHEDVEAFINDMSVFCSHWIAPIINNHSSQHLTSDIKTPQVRKN